MRLPRLTWLKRPRNAALVVTGVLLLGLVVAAFHPQLQTRVVRDQLSQRLDAFSVERVHVLPWSVSVKELRLSHDGLALEAARVRARFSPWRLAFGVIAFDEIRVEGLDADLRDVAPSAEEPQAFPGLFALLDHGFGLALGTLDVSGRARLDDEHAIRFRADGGGLAPETQGAVDIDVVVLRASDDSRVEIAGTLSVVQGEAGTFEAIGADLLATATSPMLRSDELVELLVHAEPVTLPRTDLESGEAVGTYISGDRFRFTVSKPGSDTDLARLSLSGVHDATSRTVSGELQLQTTGGLIAFYAPEAVAPDIEEGAEGTFHLDLAGGAGALELRGTAEIRELERVLGANDALPRTLAFAHTLSASMDAQRLDVHALDARLNGNAADPLLVLSLSQPLTVLFESPRSMLAGKRTLGTLELGGVPMNWVNGLLSEPVVRDGALRGSFELRTADGALLLSSVATVGIEAATFDEAFAIPDALGLSVEPSLRYHEDEVRFALKDLRLQLGDSRLATLDVEAALKLTTEGLPTPDVKLRGSFDVNGLAALPLIAERLAGRPLPEALRADIDARISVNAERVRIRKLEASVRRHDAPPLLSATALQAFSIAIATDGPPEFRNPEGELALLSIDNFDLALIDPWVTDVSFAGTLESGTFAVGTGAEGALAVQTRSPLRLRDVAVRLGEDRLIANLSVSVRPEIEYTPARVDVRYSAFEALVDGQPVMSADGALSAPLDTDAPPRVEASGHAELDLAQLGRVPALAAAFEALPAKRKWRLALDYDLAGDADRIDVATLRGAITVDGQERVRLENDAALVLRPRIEADEALAQHFTGAISAELDGLSSALLTDLLPLGGLGFTDLSVLAILRSDGSVLTADTLKPLNVSGVRVDGADGALLNPFSASASAAVRVSGQTIDASLETLSIVFDGYRERPAVSGNLSFTLEPPHVIPLRNVKAKLSGFLPALLAQPAVMPGHHLRAGGFTLETTVREDGSIETDAVLDGLAAAEALAISGASATAAGALAANGRGFALSMPLTWLGRTGKTDGLLVASFDPSESAKSLLNLEFTSERFLLNDVLAALASIRGEKAVTRPPAAAPDKTAAAISPDLTPDERAFWDLLPYDTRVNYRIRDLYYTDYVILNDVTGRIDLTSTRFTLASLSARFHDSPMKFDGALDFVDGSPRPYELELAGTISEFDLNQFFSELVPGTKPRVEGLFSVAIDGYGSSPNMAQFRNELLFDAKLNSREGLFRPLPPDSALMIGASDVLGIVGEGLSYVPTGGFGAGAVSRLVNYISVIDYDRIDINVVRDETRDIVIRQFLVQSPTISLTAQGGIDYEDGKDILDSALTLDAHLNMSGKGAAILYSMNLLEDEQDAYGYYKGPAFRIRGTPSAAESNFADVVNTAADGTVKGAITRPISGLIGNIIHRWFGTDPIPYREGASPAPESVRDPEQTPP